jgi:hypothetical protein
VIVYLWTAVTSETAVPGGIVGISDDDGRARAAAGQCLRDGHARLAYVETAQTGMLALTFVPCYVRTGTGWWATPGAGDEVRWVRFTSPEAAAGLRTLAESAAMRTGRDA